MSFTEEQVIVANESPGTTEKYRIHHHYPLDIDQQDQPPSETIPYDYSLHDKLKTIAGISGNVLEWYDFAVFGFFGDISKYSQMETDIILFHHTKQKNTRSGLHSLCSQSMFAHIFLLLNLSFCFFFRSRRRILPSTKWKCSNY
jgi:hypothetical protein